MSSNVGWFEVLSPNADTSRAFYSALFGWKYEVMPNAYGVVAPGGPGTIPGGVGQHPAGKSWTTFYVSVDDVAASLAKAVELGGKALTEPYAMPDGMKLAVFADIDGNVIGLSQAAA